MMVPSSKKKEMLAGRRNIHHDDIQHKNTPLFADYCYADY
jgi:hypothetical protein